MKDMWDNMYLVAASGTGVLHAPELVPMKTDAYPVVYRAQNVSKGIDGVRETVPE